MAIQENPEVTITYFRYTPGENLPSVGGAVAMPLNSPVMSLYNKIGREDNCTSYMRLWKPHSFLSLNGFEDLRDRLETADFQLDRFCTLLSWHSSETLKQVLDGRASARAATRTTLVVELLPRSVLKRPEPEGGRLGEQPGDVILQMQKRFKTTMEVSRGATQLNTGKPSQYREFQGGSAPILNGRYAGRPSPRALPIEIHHWAFAHFVGIYQDNTHQLPDSIIDLTVQLSDLSSQIATSEAARQQTIRELLNSIIGFPIIQTVHLNRTSADHSAIQSCSSGSISSAAICIAEEKLDLSSYGDPSTQGEFSYLQHWTQQRQKALTEATSCPSFIVAIAGPWLVILGAVFTSHAIVQRLTDFIWLGNSWVIDDTNTLRLGRALAALREAVTELKLFYGTVSPVADPTARFFPYATSFIDENGSRVQFSYKRPLKPEVEPSESVTFLAVTPDGRQLVVKFVERYGAEAHLALAGKGKAPALFYYGDVWPDKEVASAGCRSRKMVVMEYIEGKTCVKDGASIPVRAAVSTAIKYLHSLGFVHGDIRLPNIFIPQAREGEGDGDDEGSRVKILDFDWAGKEGEARYPLRLATDLFPPDSRDHGLISKAHDSYMVERL